MRKTVLWQSPHVRASVSALIAFAAILIVVGCGGGGGGPVGSNVNGNNNNGGAPPGQDPTLPFLRGKVVESANTTNGVAGATVTLHSPGRSDISVTTAVDGSFVIANVPNSYNTFTVTSPDPVKWYNFANYGGKNYDTVNCRLPLPGLAVGSNNTGTVVLSSGGNNPPPPPPVGGCP